MGCRGSFHQPVWQARRGGKAGKCLGWRKEGGELCLVPGFTFSEGPQNIKIGQWCRPPIGSPWFTGFGQSETCQQRNDRHWRMPARPGVSGLFTRNSRLPQYAIKSKASTEGWFKVIPFKHMHHPPGKLIAWGYYLGPGEEGKKKEELGLQFRSIIFNFKKKKNQLNCLKTEILNKILIYKADRSGNVLVGGAPTGLLFVPWNTRGSVEKNTGTGVLDHYF